MKKYIAIFLLGVILCQGCGKREDDITKLAFVTNAYDMAYDYFNSEKVFQFDVNAGESIHLDVVCDTGSIEVKIVDLDDNPIYQQTLTVSLTEDIKVEKTGRYIAIMTGNETAGEIQIRIKEE